MALTSLLWSATLYALRVGTTGLAGVKERAVRIVSLLQSATEIVCALGLSEALVGVTHECDYPPFARSRPIVTHSLLDHDGTTSEEIDQAVRQQLQDGLSLYELDYALLAQIAPDLVLTQALCDVCAVAYGDVERAIRDISAAGDALAPKVLSLEPTGLEDILATIEHIGAAAGVAQRAATLVSELRTRIERVRTH